VDIKGDILINNPQQFNFNTNIQKSWMYTSKSIQKWNINWHFLKDLY